MSFFNKIFGDPNEKYIKKLGPTVEKISSFEPKYQKLSDEELRGLGPKWKSEVAKGKTLDEILPEVFASVRESAGRTMGGRHYDVQMIGALVMNTGQIAEMKTGEGKTSYAVSPAATLNALSGKGVHVVTVNDYLSKRDAGWVGGVYDALGLTVSAIVHDQAFIYDKSFINEDEPEESFKHLKPCTRKEAYAADITYGTNNEFGFDYLRDNMAPSLEHKVQRGFNYAIVDEIDSILIDEARTPLIISAPAQEAGEKYKKFASLIPRLKEGDHYNIDEKMRAATLTDDGIKKMEELLGVENIYTDAGVSEVHHLEQALKAQVLFHRDKDYVVKDDEVIIIDEFTGRMMPGRRYSEGLHQAIEAKEGVKIKQESITMATVTFQNYFRMYEKLSGMTGTAFTEAEEFAKIYNLDVIVIPTNRPITRIDQPDLIYKTEQDKFNAVIKDIKERQVKGQPVLVGTISIEKNELFSHLLEKEGVTHNILNAKNHLKEADFVAAAGTKGAVTLATNMAGRGVDIKLGGPNGTPEEVAEIKELGGLYVIGTERHESRRIDNQLRGRSGRQGDPGESRFYVSTEDDLMRIFGSDKIKGIMNTLGVPDDMPIEHKMISNALESAQKKVEGHNFDTRKHLLEYDDVINKHREVIYKKRDRILELYENLKNKKEIKEVAAIDNDEDDRKVEEPKYKSFRDMIMEMISAEIEAVVSFHTQAENENIWNIDEIYEVCDTIFPLPLEVRLKMDDIQKTAGDKVADIAARNKLINYLTLLAEDAYNELEEKINSIPEAKTEGNIKPINEVEKMILLRAIDMIWVDHIDAMDHMRSGIGLRGYAQKDPLVEYKREAYQMFIALQNNIQKQVAYSIFKVGMTPKEQQAVTENLQFKGAVKTGDSESLLNQNRDNVSSTVPARFTSAPSGTVTTAPIEKKEKVGRNDPCPCGSGKKYKKCHGA